MKKVDPVLQERLEKLISAMGFELAGCELFSQGGQMVLRIYIDTETKDKKGITVDDCSKVSRQVSAMLDVENLIQYRYTLEVSSPGINRPLFEIKHFQKYIGSHVKVTVSAPIKERRQLKGILQRIEGENLFLLLDEVGEEVIVPFSAIEKANVIGEIHL